MSQRSISTGDHPIVVIDEVFGSLEVKSWARPEVTMLSGSGDDAGLQQQGDVVHVRTMGSCWLHVPEGAQVQVVSVHGEAHLKRLEKGLQIGRVLGSLSLREVGEVQVESVYGDLSMRQVAGSLSAKQVLGNASLRQVQGGCTLERVAGNLDLRDVDGDLSASVGGNARLSFSGLQGQSCRLQASGNLICRVPLDASLHANLTSEAQEIHVSLPDENTTYNEQTHQLTLGDGKAALDLSAGGMISISSQENGWAGAWDITLDEETLRDVGAAVEAQVALQMKALNERMEGFSATVENAGLPPKESERILRHAREASARTQERLERKMAAAQRKAEQKARQAEHHHGGHSWKFVWRTPPGAPASKPGVAEASASDEERLMVLRMLEQKKITLEQAEHLLEALEGK